MKQKKKEKREKAKKAKRLKKNVESNPQTPTSEQPASAKEETEREEMGLVKYSTSCSR